MRIILLAIFTVLLMSGCTDSATPVEKEKQEEEKVVKTVDDPVKEEEQEEVAETSTAPIERTEQIEAGKYPWEVYEMYGNGEGIMDRAQNGEVLFLFSDAEALETAILEFAKGSGDKTNEWWHSVVLYFNGTVKEYHPDKADYFAKMKEVEDALLAGEIDKLPNLITEAKQLRGAK